MKEKTKPQDDQTSLAARPPFFAGMAAGAIIMGSIGLIALVGMVSVLQSSKSATPSQATAVSDSDQAAGAAVGQTIDPATFGVTRGDGAYTLVEYSDTECPFCKDFHDVLKRAVTERADISWAYKHFPIRSRHTKAEKEAIAVACADGQGKNWEYLDEVFAHTNSNDTLPEQELYTIADDLNMNTAQLRACVDNQETLDQVQKDEAEALALGGRGTPLTMLVDANGKILTVFEGYYSYNELTPILNAVIAKNQ